MNTKRNHDSEFAEDRPRLQYEAFQVAESAKEMLSRWLKPYLAVPTLLCVLIGAGSWLHLAGIQESLDSKVETHLQAALEKKRQAIDESTQFMLNRQVEGMLKAREESEKVLRDFRAQAESNLETIRANADEVQKVIVASLEGKASKLNADAGKIAEDYKAFDMKLSQMKTQLIVFDSSISKLENIILTRYSDFNSKVGSTLTQIKTREPILSGKDSIDLSPRIGAIFDQADQQLNVGGVLCYAIAAEAKRRSIMMPDLSVRSICAAANPFDGRDGDIDGASLLGALVGLQITGAYEVDDWPYGAKKPKSDAVPFIKIVSFEKIRMNDSSRMLECLRQYRPLVVTINLDHLTSEPDDKGWIRLPKHGSALGALYEDFSHCMCVLGYDPKDKSVLLANTLGPTWGDRGFARIAISDLLTVVTEAYVLELPTADTPAETMPNGAAKSEIKDLRLSR